MLIRSTPARVAFSIAFGLLVGLSSFATGSSLAWAISLGTVTLLLAFGVQTYYVKRSRAKP